MWKFRRLAETSVHAVGNPHARLLSQFEQRLVEALGSRVRLADLRDGLRELGRPALDLRASLLPGFVHALEHVAKADHSHAGFGRPIGAAVKRLERRRQEHRHRPAAVTRECGDGGHINLVEIGPLLAVDLDADVVGVHQVGDGRIFKTFVLHHVAPMTRAVADREKDRPVERAGRFKRFGPPWVPIDGIVSVLLQIRARLFRQSIR